jgi:hypothetical protein
MARTYTLVFFGYHGKTKLQHSLKEPISAERIARKRGYQKEDASHRFSSFSKVSRLRVSSSCSVHPPGLSRTNRLDSRYNSSSSNISAIRKAFMGRPGACVRRNLRHSCCKEGTHNLCEIFMRLSALFHVMVHSRLATTE